MVGSHSSLSKATLQISTLNKLIKIQLLPPGSNTGSKERIVLINRHRSRFYLEVLTREAASFPNYINHFILILAYKAVQSELTYLMLELFIYCNERNPCHMTLLIPFQK